MKDINILHERKKVPSLFTRRSLLPSADISSDFNRTIDTFTNLFNQLLSPLSGTFGTFENIKLYPSVDVVEDDDRYKVELEMPGMDEENIKVSLDRNVLTITGEKSVSKKNEEKNYLHREINYGFYERSVLLPEGLDTDQAKASFKKGMLWVSIPKNKELMANKKELKIEKAE